MDLYAYLELALVWEAPTEPKLLEGLNWQKLSSQAYIRLLSVALVLSVLSVAASAEAALKRGDNNEAVRVLQQRLKDLGYFPRSQPTTNLYGTITENAVREFQRSYAAYRLQPTGRADDFTLYYLGLGSYPRIPAPPLFPPNPGLPRTIRACEGLRFNEKTNPLVRSLQHKLKDLGYFHGNVDGKYRERTRDAVTRFQQANGLTPTGCADYTTQVAIHQGITEIYPNPPLPFTGVGLNTFGTLGEGSTGELVRQLQTQLKNLGFNPGGIDGVYGNNTAFAVKRFQERVGLYADGVASSSVQFALRNATRASVANPFSTPPYYPTTLGYRQF